MTDGLPPVDHDASALPLSLRLPNSASAPVRRPANYFVRHWRGELSLGISYWRNGMLLATVGPVLVARLVSETFRICSGSDILLRVGAAEALISFPIWFALQVWAHVGTWRSSNHHVERGGHGFWAMVGKLVVSCTLLLDWQSVPTLA